MTHFWEFADNDVSESNFQSFYYNITIVICQFILAGVCVLACLGGGQLDNFTFALILLPAENNFMIRIGYLASEKNLSWDL